MLPVKFNAGDTVILKKKHPCSSFEFKVLRGGTDVKIVCIGCQRNLTVERAAFEKMIKKVIPNNENGENN